MRGYDIQYAVHRFKLRGQKYEPDLILWFLKWDDFEEMKDVLTDKIRQVESEQAQLEFCPKDKDVALKPFIDLTKEFQREYGEENLLQTQYSYIKEILLLHSNAVFVFTYSEVPEKEKLLMKQFTLERSNIHFWDGISYRDLDILPDGHPSISGYEMIARQVSAQLLKEKIIPCD